MKALSPTYTAELFRPLHEELVSLLRSLDREDWRRPTVAGEWRVRDVVAHLLDGDLRRLSFHRDGHPVPSSPNPIESQDDLVAFLNALNHAWVEASERLSPAVLVELIEWSGCQVAMFVEGLDPSASARFAVAWAGEDESLNWMDVGREYTERWHHQQQIREAVGRPLLLGQKWMRPLLEMSVRSLLPAYAASDAPVGSEVQIDITGEGGGSWTLVREEHDWTLYEGAGSTPRSTVQLSTDTAWRLFYNARDFEGMAGLDVEGDRALAEPFLTARSVMV